MRFASVMAAALSLMLAGCLVSEDQIFTGGQLIAPVTKDSFRIASYKSDGRLEQRIAVKRDGRAYQATVIEGEAKGKEYIAGFLKNEFSNHLIFVNVGNKFYYGLGLIEGNKLTLYQFYNDLMDVMLDDDSKASVSNPFANIDASPAARVRAMLAPYKQRFKSKPFVFDVKNLAELKDLIRAWLILPDNMRKLKTQFVIE